MTAALEGGEWSAARPGYTLHPWKDPVPILQEAGWAPGPVWTGGKSRPHRDSINKFPSLSLIPTPYLNLNILRFVTWEKYTMPLHLKHLPTSGKNCISRTARKHVIHEIWEYGGENAYKWGYLLDGGIKIVGLMKNRCKYFAVLNDELAEEDQKQIYLLKSF